MYVFTLIQNCPCFAAIILIHIMYVLILLQCLKQIMNRNSRNKRLHLLNENSSDLFFFNLYDFFKNVLKKCVTGITEHKHVSKYTQGNLFSELLFLIMLAVLVAFKMAGSKKDVMICVNLL